MNKYYQVLEYLTESGASILCNQYCAYFNCIFQRGCAVFFCGWQCSSNCCPINRFVYLIFCDLLSNSGIFRRCRTTKEKEIAGRQDRGEARGRFVSPNQDERTVPVSFGISKN